ncbi:MAG: DUF3822 family protein [Flavobacteriales bacterium]|nr:DUF3822 family protein [Flavobacteriales bacterium]
MERGKHRDAGYDRTRDRAYHVGLVIGHELTVCAVHDVADGVPRFIAWEDGIDLLMHPDLPASPRSVSYVMLPEQSTLVPDGALDQGSRSGYLQLVHGTIRHGTIHDEPVRTLGATCLYVHDEAHERKVLDRFPNARSLSLRTVLLNGAQRRSIGKPLVLVHRCAGRVDITIADGLRILLSNSYPARTAEDILYFGLLAVQKSGSVPEQVAIRSGGTHFGQAEQELFDRYFVDHGPAVASLWPGATKDALTDAGRCMAALDQFACV